MIRSFQPPYSAAYGVSRAKWRKLSGLEKSRLFHQFREMERAYFISELLLGNQPEWVLKITKPINSDVPFVPYTETIDCERDYQPDFEEPAF